MEMNDYRLAWMLMKKQMLDTFTREQAEGEDGWEYRNDQRRAQEVLNQMEQIEIEIMFGRETKE